MSDSTTGTTSSGTPINTLPAAVAVTPLQDQILILQPDQTSSATTKPLIPRIITPGALLSGMGGVQAPAAGGLVSSDGTVLTSITVGGGLVLSAGTLTAAGLSVPVSAPLVSSASGSLTAVQLGSGLSLSGGTLSVAASATVAVPAAAPLLASAGGTLTQVAVGANLTLSAGTLSAAAGLAAPSTVALVASTGSALQPVAVVGASYADGTLTVPPYQLPPASSASLGGVKAGSNITIAVDGTISGPAPLVVPNASGLLSGAGGTLSSVTLGQTLQLSNGILNALVPAVPSGAPLLSATSGTLTPVQVGGSLILANGTLTAPVGLVAPATAGLVSSTGSSLTNVALGANLSLSNGTLTAASNATPVPPSAPLLSAVAGVLTAIALGGGLTLTAGTLTAATGAAAPPTAGLVASTGSALASVTIVGASYNAGTLTVPGYSLPAATAAALGGVKQGANITIAPDGTVSAPTPVAVPSTAPLLASTGGTLAAVQLGANLSLSNGTLTAAGQAVPATAALLASTGSSLTTVSLVGASYSAGTLTVPGYTLTAATASALGGVKAGANLTIANDGTISGPAPVTVPTAAALLSSNAGGSLTPTALGTGLALSGGTLTATATGLAAPAAASLVSSTGTSLTGVQLGANLSMNGGTLSAISLVAPSAGLVSSTGTSLSTVSLAGASYANGTLTVPAYTLPAATAAALGGVKQGGNIGITAAGVISVVAPTSAQLLASDANGSLTAVTVGANLTLSAGGTLSGTASAGVTAPAAAPLVSSSGTSLSGVALGANLQLTNGTLAAVSLVAPSAGLVSSTGSSLAPVALIGASYSAGTLTVPSLAVPAAAQLLASNAGGSLTPVSLGANLSLSAGGTLSAAASSGAAVPAAAPLVSSSGTAFTPVALGAGLVSAGGTLSLGALTPVTPYGTNATVAIAIALALGRLLYVDDFGAVGNAITSGSGGGTDDAPAFNAAIAALGPRGGIIRQSAKSYRVASTINIYTCPVRFIGEAQFESASAQSGTVLCMDTVAVPGTTSTVTSTQDGPAGQNLLYIPTAGLSVGQTVTVGIAGALPMLTKITIIDGSATFVTLSNAIAVDIPSGTSVTVYTTVRPFVLGQDYTSSPSFQPSGAAIGTHFENLTLYQIQPAAASAPIYSATLSTASVAGATTLTLSAVTNLAVGQTFTGPQQAVPLVGAAPLTITAINTGTNVITLSGPVPLPIAANTALSFTLLTPWAPNPYDYVFTVVNLSGGFQFTNIFFLGCTNGIYSRTCGHMRFNSVEGQCFNSMIKTENCLDSPYFDYIRSWDYETGNLNQRVYQQANQNVLEFGRCDGFEVQRLFCFSAHSAIHLYQEPAITGQANSSANTAGGCGSGNVKFMSEDECALGLWIDNINPAGTAKLVQVGIWNHNSISAQYYPYCVPGGRALLSTVANYITIQVAMLSVYKCDTSSIGFYGNTNNLQISIFEVLGGNFANLTPNYPQIDIGDNGGVGFSNRCVVAMATILNSGTGPLFGSSTATTQATTTNPTPGNGIFQCLSVTLNGAAPTTAIQSWNTPLLLVQNTVTATSSAAVATFGAGAGGQIRIVPNAPAGAYASAVQAGDVVVVYDVQGAGNTGRLVFAHSNYPLILSNLGAHILAGSTPVIQGSTSLTLSAPTVNLLVAQYFGTGVVGGVNCNSTTTAVQLNEPSSIISTSAAGSAGAILPVIPAATNMGYYVTTINASANAVPLAPPTGTTLFSGAASFSLLPGTSVTFLFENNVWIPVNVANTTGALPTSTSSSSAAVLGPYATVSALPAASSNPGALAWCTGLTTKGVWPVLFSDNTNWIMTNNEVAL